MDNETAFKYHRLPRTHIRLFLLTPGKPEDEITGSLATGHIIQFGQGKWRYNALSYTWGDISKTTRIKMKDDSHNLTGWLTVTTSVVEALSRFRHPTGVMAFWVDQICIDQSSTAEKEDQIGWMKIIYERAGSVNAWLGPSAADSDLAMAILTRGDWNKDPRKILRGEDLTELSNVPPNHILRNQLSAGYVKAIIALFKRPYWTRTWIIQELTAQTASQTLIGCGDATVQLHKILWFTLAIRHTLLLPREDQAEIQSLYQVNFMPKLRAFQEQRKPFPQRPILEILTNLRGTSATDPRDHIYSILGFMAEAASKDYERFRPDYSISAYDTFVSFTVWHIQHHRNLDVLGCCSPIARPIKRSNPTIGQILTTVGSATDNSLSDIISGDEYLPFWVPDWRFEWWIDIFPRRRVPNDLSSKLLYDASGTDLPPFSISKEDRARVEGLTVSGIRLATLASVNRNALDWGEVTEQAERLWAPVDRSAKCPLTGLDMFTVFKRTVFGDLKGADSGYDNVQAWRRTRDDEEYEWPIKPLTDAGVGRDVCPDSVTMRRICTCRCPFYTKTSSDSIAGLFGLGPAWAQADDELWIIKGSKFPLVLRRGWVTEEIPIQVLDLETGKLITREMALNNPVYKIVGESFVLGLMDGQALEMLGSNPTRDVPPQFADMDREFRQIELH